MSVSLFHNEYSNKKQAFIKQRCILEQNFQDIDPVLLEKTFFPAPVAFIYFFHEYQQHKIKLDNADRKQ